MQTIRTQALSAEAFLPYGFFTNMVKPATEKLGTSPIEFYRDMVQQDLGDARTVSFSICRTEPRDMKVDISEYHSRCGEGIIPLDGDVVIHVAPASAVNDTVPLDKMAAFKIPSGTMVVLRPGVWHHAPLSLEGKTVNTLIVLPERTYANDCMVAELPETDHIAITL